MRAGDSRSSPLRRFILRSTKIFRNCRVQNSVHLPKPPLRPLGRALLPRKSHPELQEKAPRFLRRPQRSRSQPRSASGKKWSCLGLPDQSTAARSADSCSSITRWLVLKTMLSHKRDNVYKLFGSSLLLKATQTSKLDSACLKNILRQMMVDFKLFLILSSLAVIKQHQIHRKPFLEITF
jgi:hypothetical protein